MGRKLTLPFFVATLVATWYGGIMGVTQIAFENGIYNFVTQGCFWYITYIIFAFFMVDKIRSFNALTLPEMVGQMYGPKSEKVAGLFNFFNVVPIGYSISLGLFLQAIFGGSFEIMTIAGVLVVIAYSIFGGFRAVVFSDIIQFGVMCTGVFLVLLFSVDNYGGLSFLQENLPSGHFDPLGKYPIHTTLVWGFIALSTLVDPNFYQRCFAANSNKTAKKGILCATLIWICFDICTTAGAMYARAVIPETDSGMAYLTYALQILPEGVRGFVLAGVLATILSTMDSYLFMAGTILSYDLFPKKWSHLKVSHYAGVIFVGLLSIVLSFMFEGNIRNAWKTLGSYSSACLLFPVILGYLTKNRIKDIQFVLVCLTGVIGTTVWRFCPRPESLQSIDELYAGLFSTIFAYMTVKLYGFLSRS